ncbi:TonB-dependent receptor [Chitinasiproducens palmae]|uniref:Iron complex outermembrane recepter protein n=1 Tax=Chitinasiproducens palmae TaxID=1770053 RepID=A0A1H2PLY3_9BURK|nr:TonB-dependent receptor [Chitinasiproducens palmae]SDV47051.1 iron complex outermembrane recepter protein [Chitinasiproducens palmae]
MFPKRTAIALAVQRLVLGVAALGAINGAAHAQQPPAIDGASIANSAQTADPSATPTRRDASEGQSSTPSDTLPTISVQATAVDDGKPAPYAGGQVTRAGGLGVLGVADVMDQPFNTTNYTEQLMRDTQARSLADVVTNNASVRSVSTAGGFQDSFQIRGFSVNAADVSYNGLYGLVSSSRMPVNLLERVEVLQGPGALMYGVGPSASIGGAINIVPKHADDQPLTRVTATYQSRAQFGVQADVGRRFGDEGQWGIRVNGLFNDGQATVAHGNQLQGNGSINLDYRGRKLRWSLDSYDIVENTNEFRSQISGTSVTSIPNPPSPWQSLYPGAKFKFRDAATATRLEYDINDFVTVYGAAGVHYGMATESFPRTATALNTAGDFTIRNGYYDAYNRTRTIDTGARFHFDTFGVRHTLVAGFTSLNEDIGYAYALSSTANPSNLYNPQPLPTMPERVGWGRSQHVRLNSEQVIDTLSFWDDRLLIMAGLRNQTIAIDAYSPTTGVRSSTYDSSAVSPLAGIVIKPLRNVSVYGNFTSGLSQGPTAPTTANNANEVFAPYKSKQYEAGVKVDWGRVMTSASVFQLTQPNGVLGADNVYRLSGNTRVRGLELNAFGEAVPGLRLLASTTLYDAKLQGTVGGTNDDNRPAGVPNYTFNLGADWSVPWVQGLGVNGRIIHTSAEYLDAANKLRIPAWTRYDIGLRYSTQIMRKNVVFRANLENVFGKRYWVAQSVYLMESAPRTVLLSAQIDF